MLKLYHSAYSTCSQKVRLCLAEKGLEWESYEVDLAHQEQTTPGYLKINPNGVVPALTYNGRSVIESSVICEFLDDVYPERSLSPADPVERAKMRAWLRFIEEISTPAVRVPSLNGIYKRRMAEMTAEEREALVEAKPLRKFTFRKLGPAGFSEEEVIESHDKLRLTTKRIAEAMDQGPWLVGDKYTIADACMTPMIQRLEDLGLEEYWADRPQVADWLARIQARSSFSVTYYPGAHFTQDGPTQVRPALNR